MPWLRLRADTNDHMVRGPWPSLQSSSRAAAATYEQARMARAALLVAEKGIAQQAGGLDPPCRVVSFDDLERGGALAVTVDTAPDDLAVLQFTSGSTRQPRVVQLAHRHITANVDGIVA